MPSVSILSGFEHSEHAWFGQRKRLETMRTKRSWIELCAKPFWSILASFPKNGLSGQCPHDHLAWRIRDNVDKILPPSHSVRKIKRQNGRFVHVVLVGAIPQNWGTPFLHALDTAQATTRAVPAYRPETTQIASPSVGPFVHWFG